MWVAWLPIVPFLALVVALAYYALVHRHREARQLIAAWAQDQQVALLSCRWQLKPYDYWPLSLSMLTYRIKVADEARRERLGWLQVREVWYQDRIDVIWDDENPAG